MARVLPLAIALLLGSCLNAPRDNPYDPHNTDKASVEGKNVEFDSSALAGVNIILMMDRAVIKTDTSGDDGRFELDGIDPGIYSIEARALHYQPALVRADTMIAGAKIMHNFVFNSLHFEDDPAGASEPYLFRVQQGAWRIRDDTTQPAMHTAPRVYQGYCYDSAGGGLTVCGRNLRDFVAKVKVAVSDASTPGWQAGIAFHYQDAGNYYLLQFSADSIRFLKVAAGVRTELSSCAAAIPTGTWSQVAIGCSYSLAFCYYNNAYQLSMADNSFTQGSVGFWFSHQSAAGVTEIGFDDLTFYPNIADTVCE